MIVSALWHSSGFVSTDLTAISHVKDPVDGKSTFMSRYAKTDNDYIIGNVDLKASTLLKNTGVTKTYSPPRTERLFVPGLEDLAETKTKIVELSKHQQAAAQRRLRWAEDAKPERRNQNQTEKDFINHKAELPHGLRWASYTKPQPQLPIPTMDDDDSDSDKDDEELPCGLTWAEDAKPHHKNHNSDARHPLRKALHKAKVLKDEKEAMAAARKDMFIQQNKRLREAMTKFHAQRAKQLQIEREMQHQAELKKQQQRQQSPASSILSTSFASPASTYITSSSSAPEPSFVPRPPGWWRLREPTPQPAPTIVFKKQEVTRNASAVSLITTSLKGNTSSVFSARASGSTFASSVSDDRSVLEMKITKPRVTLDMAKEYGIQVLSTSQLGNAFEDSEDEE